jgi:putative tryptophan/tyrosine transport system substrate-binding protein
VASHRTRTAACADSPDRRTHAVPRERSPGVIRAQVFRREFEKLGWTVGGNLQISYHWGTGDADWVRSAAAQLLGETLDLMLANGDATARAAQQLTRTVPVIFIAGGDPVADGWVQSLAHPGGNLTGFAVMEPSPGAKLLGMLKQVAPRVARVAILMNPDKRHTPTYSRVVGPCRSRLCR